MRKSKTRGLYLREGRGGGGGKGFRDDCISTVKEHALFSS
jgi:hypothetical protein